MDTYSVLRDHGSDHQSEVTLRSLPYPTKPMTAVEMQRYSRSLVTMYCY